MSRPGDRVKALHELYKETSGSIKKNDENRKRLLPELRREMERQPTGNPQIHLIESHLKMYDDDDISLYATLREIINEIDFLMLSKRFSKEVKNELDIIRIRAQRKYSAYRLDPICIECALDIIALDDYIQMIDEYRVNHDPVVYEKFHMDMVSMRDKLLEKRKGIAIKNCNKSEECIRNYKTPFDRLTTQLEDRKMERFKEKPPWKDIYWERVQRTRACSDTRPRSKQDPFCNDEST